MGKIIGIYNQKGGTGKTSSAINLAAFLEERGSDVLAVDIDIQGNFSDAMLLDNYDRNELSSIINVINGDVDIKDACYPVMFRMKSKSQPKRVHIDMIPAPMEETNKLYSDPLLLKKALSKIISEYDYVIIDFPPERPYADTDKMEFNIVTLALCCANEIITPCTTDIDSISGFSTLTTHANILRQLYNPNLYKMSFYINDFSGYSTENEFLECCKTMPSYSGICIPSSGLIKTSRNIERPMAWFNRNSMLAKSYEALAKYVE